MRRRLSRKPAGAIAATAALIILSIAAACSAVTLQEVRVLRDPLLQDLSYSDAGAKPGRDFQASRPLPAFIASLSEPSPPSGAGPSPASGRARSAPAATQAARSAVLEAAPGLLSAAAGEPPEDTSLTRRLLDFPKVLLEDAVEAVRAPTRWGLSDWLVLGAVAAGTAATFAADESVRDLVLDHRNGTARDAFKAIGYFGRTEIQVGLIGTLLAAGKLADNPRWMDSGVQGLESILLTGAVVLPLKAVIGRERPDDADDAFTFSPFTLHNSAFPSGDTATAFALGTVIASQSEDPWVSGTAYGLATLVGASRIYRYKHWLSDVVGGAAIGHLIGRFVAKMHRERKEQKAGKRSAARFHVIPLLSPDAPGLAVSVELNGS